MVGPVLRMVTSQPNSCGRLLGRTRSRAAIAVLLSVLSDESCSIRRLVSKSSVNLSIAAANRHRLPYPDDFPCPFLTDEPVFVPARRVEAVFAWSPGGIHSVDAVGR